MDFDVFLCKISVFEVPAFLTLYDTTQRQNDVNLCMIFFKLLKSQVFVTWKCQESQKRIFYIETHQNQYIEVAKNQDFRDFLKILYKLTSFFTSCSAVWRQKNVKQSQKPQTFNFLHRKTLKSIYWPISGKKNRDFSNFRKIIHKLTSFLTLCSVVWRQKRFNNLRNLKNGYST